MKRKSLPRLWTQNSENVFTLNIHHIKEETDLNEAVSPKHWNIIQSLSFFHCHCFSIPKILEISSSVHENVLYFLSENFVFLAEESPQQKEKFTKRINTNKIRRKFPLDKFLRTK